MLRQRLDTVELLERVSDDSQLLEQLVSLFASRSVELIDELKAEAAPSASLDSGRVAKTAHQLRGMLANMSGHQAYDLAAELETKGRNQQLDGLAAYVDSLQSAVSALTVDLQHLVASRGALECGIPG